MVLLHLRHLLEALYEEEQAAHQKGKCMKVEKITYEGQPCRKCNTPVVKRSHNGPTKPGQKYWFRYWFDCPKCKARYMVEAARVTTTETEPTP